MVIHYKCNGAINLFVLTINMAKEVNEHIFYLLVFCNIVFTGADFNEYYDWVPEWDSFFKLNPFKGNVLFGI